MFLFLLSSMHLLQNLCGFWTHASLTPSPPAFPLHLSPSEMPALRKREGMIKKRKCEHQQKNGCLASCIIFRNKQCETVLASLLAYTHKDCVCVPVSENKRKTKRGKRYSPLRMTEVSHRDSALGKHVIARDPISSNKEDKQWSWVNFIVCVT